MALSYTITQLPAIVTVASADVFPIVDVDDFDEAPTGTTKKITRAQLFTSPTFTGTTTTAALASTTGQFSSTLTAQAGLIVSGGGATVTGTAAFVNAVTVGGTLGVTGVATFSNNIGVTGQATVSAASNTATLRVFSNGGSGKDYALRSNTDGSLDLADLTAGQQRLVISTAGVVGIVGNATIGGTLVVGAGLTVSAGGAAITGTVTASAGATIAGGLNVTSNGATITGASTFSSTLGVTGAITAPQLVVTNGTIGGNVAIGGGGVQFGTSSNHTLRFYTNNLEKWYIATNGDIVAVTDAAFDFGVSGGRVRNILASGTITASAFAGALTGNVTGNVSGSSGSTTGNAATATALQTARNINGVAFDGTAPITVTAAAGTVTGTTLASNVVTSSLTTVGTLGTLTVSGGVQSGAVTTSQIYGNGSAPSASSILGSGTANITGTDTAFRVQYVNGVGTPSVPAVVASIAFSTAFSGTPRITMTQVRQLGSQYRRLVVGSPTASGFDIYCVDSANLSANEPMYLDIHVIG